MWVANALLVLFGLAAVGEGLLRTRRAARSDGAGDKPEPASANAHGRFPGAIGAGIFARFERRSLLRAAKVNEKAQRRLTAQLTRTRAQLHRAETAAAIERRRRLASDLAAAEQAEAQRHALRDAEQSIAQLQAALAEARQAAAPAAATRVRVPAGRDSSGGVGGDDVSLRAVVPGEDRFDLIDLCEIALPPPVPHGTEGPAPVASSAGRILMGGTPNEAEQRAATMIELARAYIALDDLDAARAMLHDVLREGSAAQRNEAAELADKLR